MRAMGLLLMLSGWCIVLGALALLTHLGERFAFVAAGIAVEGLGLWIVGQSYREQESER